MHASIDRSEDQPGLLEDADVTRDGGKRNGEGAGQVRDLGWPDGEMSQDGTAGLVSQGSEEAVEVTRA
jgi:hypothetical protein